VLTTFDHDRYVFDALAAGASGFLLEDAPEHELLAAIRVVASGGSQFWLADVPSGTWRRSRTDANDSSRYGSACTALR
jgi:DNA-binding NarL/FixJ family response regulator